MLTEGASRDTDRVQRQARRAGKAGDVRMPNRTTRYRDERMTGTLDDGCRDRIGCAEEKNGDVGCASPKCLRERECRMGMARSISNDKGHARSAVFTRYGSVHGEFTMQAAVIVLGDLGRSPRMQYHALALAAEGVDVDLIGEEGAALAASLTHPRIRVHRLKARRGIAGVPASAIALLLVCCRLTRPDVIVAQTPPAIPTLLIVWLVATFRRSRLVLDWHNLGWTLLALRHGTGHPFVRIARALERWPAGWADAHLAVSEALAGHLRATWKLSAVHVLRDRPDQAFGSAGRRQAMRETLWRLAELRASATPAVVISPTSWTRDESLDLLIATADVLEDLWRDSGPRDGLLIVISGNGPGRAEFDARVRRRTPRRVRIVTTFAAADDYPSLVGSADAGVSLHRSSSGLDLPMKICDMFGASLPVCALDYGDTLRETLEPGRNAVLFRDPHELASALDRLFCSWPVPSELWRHLQAGAAAVAAGPRWRDAWRQEAQAVILPLAS